MSSQEVQSPAPLYKKVKRFIVRNIESGKIKPNEKLPSEHDFVEQFGVSRMTVHRAMRELTAEGFLVRIPGVGTFASSSRPQAVALELRNISDEIKARGHLHTCDLIALEAVRADANVAAALNIPTSERVFHSTLVHRENGIPIQLEERYIVPRIAPNYLEQDFTKTTPYEYLRSCSRPTEFEHLIYAVIPDEAMRRLLEMKKSEPCILVCRRTWVGDLTATLSRFFYPGGRFHLRDRHKA